MQLNDESRTSWHRLVNRTNVRQYMYPLKFFVHSCTEWQIVQKVCKFCFPFIYFLQTKNNKNVSFMISTHQCYLKKIAYVENIYIHKNNRNDKITGTLYMYVYLSEKNSIK